MESNHSEKRDANPVTALPSAAPTTAKMTIESPKETQTGQTTNVSVWAVVLIVTGAVGISAAVAVIAVLHARKKKHS